MSKRLVQFGWTRRQYTFLSAIGAFGISSYCFNTRQRSIECYKDRVANHAMIFHNCQINNVPALQKSMKELGASFDPNVRHRFGWTPLHVACANGHLEAARFLLIHGADPNYAEQPPKDLRKDYRLLSAYRTAKEQEFSSRVKSTATCDGLLPLHYAVAMGDERLVKLLLDHGADPTLTDSRQLTARDYYDADSQPQSLLDLLNEGEQRFMEAKRRIEREMRRKFPLEKKLQEAIVGQHDPIKSVASAIRRKENGWHDEDRPLVFLFLGSSGIGKTELAKQLAKYIHQDDKTGFVRIDMSEFQSKHEVAKFIGSPPGYVGYEEGGQLTEKLRKHPNAVVLLDEVEKAHIDVLTIMLQVFDEGRLTDGKGTTVDCRNAIFIMTSNLAQTEIANEAELIRAEGTGSERSETSASKKFLNNTVYPLLREHFKRDEFLGRINEVLLFLPFTTEELKKIVEMEMERWQKRAMDKHKMTVSWTKEVVESLTNGYNIRYGARSIKHEVERRIVNQIAKAHEMDQLVEGGSINFYVGDDGEVKCSTDKPPAKTFWSI